MNLSVTVKTAVAIIVSALILILIGNLSNQQSSLQLANMDLVNGTQQSIEKLDSIYALCTDLDRIEQACLASQNPALRDQHKRAVDQIEGLLTQLPVYSFVDLRQEEQFLSNRVQARLQLGEELIHSDQNSKEFKAVLADYIDSTKSMTNKIRQLIGDLKREQHNILVNNSEQLEVATVNGIFLGNVLMLMLFSLQVVIWIFVVRYVSERQRVEDSLRHAENELKAVFNRMRAIVDTAPDAIITINPDGSIESVNSAVQPMFGYGPEELVGRKLNSIVGDFFEGTELKFSRTDVEPGESEVIAKDRELVACKKDGSQVPISLAISILNLGERLVTTAIVRDITERKEAERRVREFYSTVSHELRTPLTSIRTALGLMESVGSAKMVQGKGEQLVRIARTECDRLIRLINDILDFRKIESGKLALKMQTSQAESLIDTTFDGLNTIARESDVGLVKDVDSQYSVQCDVDRIVQVLTNLVSNAIRFSPKGSNVTVQVRRLDDSKYRFTVMDKGPGIAAAQIPMLWNRFQQVETADGAHKGGTGLGLAITKAIVTEHGGNVGIESEPGTGSRFWFDLPVKSQVHSDGGADDTSTAHRIFLVDDDDELFDLLNGLLTSAGYELVRARTVAEAGRLLADRRPAVLLFNLQLPDGSGFDLVRQMVVEDHPAPVPIVVLSGREPQMHKLGTPIMIDWLMKPLNTEILRATFKKSVRNIVGDEGKALVITEAAETRAQLTEILTSCSITCVNQNDSIDSEFLGKESPDVIVLDIACGQQVCFDVFQALRQERVQPVPILMYTGKELQDEDVDKMTLGLSRHVSKSHMSEPEFLQALRELLDSRLRPNSRKA